MTVRRIIATVVEEVRCPMYLKGDLVTFVLPGVLQEETSATCALAIANLVPVVQELYNRPSALRTDEEGKVVACPGCGSSCSAMFRVRDVAKAIESGNTTVYNRKMALLVEVMRKLPLFQGIAVAHLESVVPLLHEQDIPDGTVVLQEGGPAKGLFIVMEGQVEILKLGTDGVDYLLMTRSTGEVLGEISLITGEACTATVRTKGRTKFLVVEPYEFRTLMARFPTIAEYLAKLLALRLMSTSQKVIQELDTGIVGKLAMIEPPDLIQALSMSSRTGTLVARREGIEFRLQLKNGRAIAARLDDLAGPAAFYTFLRWRHGVFRFEPGEPSGPENIEGDTMMMLMEGLRQADELGK